MTSVLLVMLVASVSLRADWINTKLSRAVSGHSLRVREDHLGKQKLTSRNKPTPGLPILLCTTKERLLMVSSVSASNTPSSTFDFYDIDRYFS